MPSTDGVAAVSASVGSIQRITDKKSSNMNLFITTWHAISGRSCCLENVQTEIWLLNKISPASRADSADSPSLNCRFPYSSASEGWVFYLISYARQHSHFVCEMVNQCLIYTSGKGAFFNGSAFQRQIRVEKNLYKLFTNFLREEIEQDIED